MTALPSPFELAADILFPPSDTWTPNKHQIPPAGDWFLWMLMGGRGSGKTAGAARYVHEHVHGPPCLPDFPGGHMIGIVGPTLGDAVTSCVTGPSGLVLHDPGVKVRQTVGGTSVRWSNGVEAKMFGAHTPEDVERFRSGGNRCLIWAEEMAAWRYLEDAWKHIRFGLRVGPHPRAIVSTTPKNRKIIREFRDRAISEPHKYIVTHATTHDNQYLNEERKQEIIDDYGGSRLGRQEIFGEILEDTPNALFTVEMFEQTRLTLSDMPLHFDRIVVAVDPQGKEGGDDTGIVVCGVINQGWDPKDPRLSHGFILEDATMNGKPNDWARRAIKAYTDWKANTIVAEKNNGHDMVRNTIQTIKNVPVDPVWASRGKAVRAEPVSTLMQQKRLHVVGQLPELEDQSCEFDPIDPDDDWSPDRMDAMVWGVTKLMVSASVAAVVDIKDKRLKGRR